MTPQLAQHEALALVEQRAGAGPATDDPLTLVIVPTPFDTYVLAYRATMRDFRTYFLDAHSGANRLWRGLHARWCCLRR